MSCQPHPLHSSVHRSFQARILEWFAISSSRESSWLMDWTCNSCISCISTTPSRKSVYFIYLCITDIKIQGTRRRKPMYDSLTMNSLPSHSSSIPTGWKSYILLQTAEPATGTWGHPLQPTRWLPLWTPAHQAFLSFPISRSLLKCTSIEWVMPSNHLILCFPFSSCLQSLPASGSFPISQLFTSGGQLFTSASAEVLPMNIQGWLPLGWTGLIKSFRTDQWFDQTISVENWYKVKHYHNCLNRIVTGCVTEITHFNNPGSVGYYPEMQPLQDNGSYHYHFMSITKKCLPLHSIRTSMNI